MKMTKSHLLRLLQAAVSEEEWNRIVACPDELPVSSFNRSVLLRLRNAAPDQDGPLCGDDVRGLFRAVTHYLEQYMNDCPQGHKWILLSCLYLTFLLELPMHPPERTGIQITMEHGRPRYLCPWKTTETDRVCRYCVCIPLTH